MRILPRPELDAVWPLVVVAETSIAAATARRAVEDAVDARVLARHRRVAPSPEVDAPDVVLADEVVSAAPDHVAHHVVVAELVAVQVDVLHQVPAVLGVERAHRLGVAAMVERVAAEEEVLHAARRIADAAVVEELAVHDAAVLRRAHPVGDELLPFASRHVRDARRLHGDAGLCRASRHAHRPVLETRLGGDQLVAGAVEADRHPPATAGEALVTEVLRDLQVCRIRRQVDEVGRDPTLHLGVGLAGMPIQHAGLAPADAAKPVGHSALAVVRKAVAAAVAGDVAYRHVLNARILALADDLDAHRPFRVVRRMLVVVLEVIAFDDAVDEMRVIRALELDHRRMVAREAVLLEDSSVQVEREVVRQGEERRRAQAVSAGQQHELAVAGGGKVRHELIEPLHVVQRLRLDRRLVIAGIVGDLARLVGSRDGNVLSTRPELDRVARLRGIGRAGRLAVRHPPFAPVVIRKSVACKVRLGHRVNGLFGDGQVGGVPHPEQMPDTVRLASLHVLAPDAEGVVASRQASERDAAVAGRHVLHDDRTRPLLRGGLRRTTRR